MWALTHPYGQEGISLRQTLGFHGCFQTVKQDICFIINPLHLSCGSCPIESYSQGSVLNKTIDFGDACSNFHCSRCPWCFGGWSKPFSPCFFPSRKNKLSYQAAFSSDKGEGEGSDIISNYKFSKLVEDRLSAAIRNQRYATGEGRYS